VTAQQLIDTIHRLGGSLELTKNDKIQYRLPAGHTHLREPLRVHSEQIRMLLRDRRPIYVSVACRCDKYLFAHIHNPKLPLPLPRRIPGDELFKLLKQMVRADTPKG